MQHNVFLDGIAFRLRPVANADVPFIIQLRGNTERSRYLHPISLRVEDQLAWLSEYYHRPDDYYFVIERMDNNQAEGLISLYDIDHIKKQGEWGRWILVPNSLAAIESAWLIYQFAFECLKLDQVYCRTVVDNQTVISFHDSCGITNRRVLEKYFEISDQAVDAVEHAFNQALWHQIKPRLGQLSTLIAKRLTHA